MDDKWLLVSDVDDTLLGDEPALAELTVALERERPRIGIALNSSRPCASLRGSLERHESLPAPDFLIGALGTEIQDAEGDMVEEYSDRFKSGWDREAIERLVPGEWGRPHPPEWQTPFKASFDIDDPEVAEWVRSRLSDERLSPKLIVTHGSKLDVIPAGAGKGTAIEFLRDRLMIDRDRVVVAGDSANDIDMFTDENHGIVVGNADAELAALVRPRIYRAKRSYAAGVLEGLRHWGVL